MVQVKSNLWPLWLLTALLFCGCQEIAIRHRAPDCNANLLRLGEALESFRQQNGKYPNSLQMLVPLYFNRISQCKAANQNTYLNSYIVDSSGQWCEISCSAARDAAERGTQDCFQVYFSQEGDLDCCPASYVPGSTNGRPPP